MPLFERTERPSFVGVIHLLPLPGSPTGTNTLAEVIERARIDAAALKSGGIDGVIIENFGDSPFSAGPVAPATVAFMTRIALAVREQLGHLPIGINVLRNDAVAAIAIAAATEAALIRVNVHTGVMVTDQA